MSVTISYEFPIPFSLMSLYSNSSRTLASWRVNLSLLYTQVTPLCLRLRLLERLGVPVRPPVL